MKKLPPSPFSAILFIKLEPFFILIDFIFLLYNTPPDISAVLLKRLVLSIINSSYILFA